MTRRYSRRAAVGALGAALVGLTGAAAPRGCAPPSGSGCDGTLVVSGPDTVSLSADAPAPRFALANEGGDERRVRDASWVVYRRTDGWERVAAGRSGGTPVTLAPDGETAWMLLVRDADDEYTVQTAAVASSTTRFVGPVSLSSGVHAFVVEGRVDGEQFDVAARFAVA